MKSAVADAGCAEIAELLADLAADLERGDRHPEQAELEERRLRGEVGPGAGREGGLVGRRSADQEDLRAADDRARAGNAGRQVRGSEVLPAVDLSLGVGHGPVHLGLRAARVDPADEVQPAVRREPGRPGARGGQVDPRRGLLGRVWPTG